jgi:hypothetical protein
LRLADGICKIDTLRIVMNLPLAFSGQ